MHENGISCVERDMEADLAARTDARRLNPRGSVPTIDADGEVLVGWSARHFEALLDRAAHARAQKL